MTNEEIYEVIEAHKARKKLQYRRGDTDWQDSHMQLTDILLNLGHGSFEYRAKPEPQPVRVYLRCRCIYYMMPEGLDNDVVNAGTEEVEDDRA